MFYTYNENAVITSKSQEQQEGARVAYCNEDFDLALYDVILVFVSEQGEILRYTKKIRSNEVIINKIQGLESQVNPSINLEACTLEELKTWQINQSIKNLEEYLHSNPVKSSCHGDREKLYTITKDKQALLTQMIMISQAAAQSNIPYQPSWNTQGEPSTYDWTIPELQQLAFEIESVVRPLINHQQIIESQIKAAGTKEEILSIDISF